MSIAVIFLLIAAILFGIAAFVPVSRINLVAAGLCAMAIAFIADRI